MIRRQKPRTHFSGGPPDEFVRRSSPNKNLHPAAIQTSPSLQIASNSPADYTQIMTMERRGGGSFDLIRYRIAWRNALIAVVVAGCVFRLAQYLADRSYWPDEALLTLNIMNRPARELAGLLDYKQAAPPLFLWVERGLFVAFGGSEYVMRAVPLAASIATLILFALLARRLLSPAAAGVAVALLAWSDRLIWHASEVKQYSGDVLCATLLFYLAFGMRRPISDIVRFAVISLGAAVLIWFSHPAAIIFGAVSLTMFFRVLRSDDGAGAGARGRLRIDHRRIIFGFVSCFHPSS